MFGPTRGDRLRLGDTNLCIEIERDLVEEKGGLGDELKFGGGKTVREGMGQATGRSDKETLDMVITNAVIVDWNGIYKVSFFFFFGLRFFCSHYLSSFFGVSNVECFPFNRSWSKVSSPNVHHSSLLHITLKKTYPFLFLSFETDFFFPFLLPSPPLKLRLI